MKPCEAVSAIAVTNNLGKVRWAPVATVNGDRYYYMMFGTGWSYLSSIHWQEDVAQGRKYRSEHRAIRKAVRGVKKITRRNRRRWHVPS